MRHMDGSCCAHLIQRCSCFNDNPELSLNVADMAGKGGSKDGLVLSEVTSPNSRATA